jgi:cell division protein FtsL
MNTMTRLYQTNAIPSQAVREQRFAWSWGSKLLILLLILSAFLVVYLKDLNRRTFIQYQNMARANQQAQMDWDKLLREQSSLLAQANVQQTAANNLHMYVPNAADIVLES